MSKSMPEPRTGTRRPDVVPYLMIEKAQAVVTFLERAFGGEVTHRVERPDGSIAHVEVRVGDSLVMMGEPSAALGETSASVYVQVDDCDAAYRRALDAGGVSIMEPTTKPHTGERYGGVRDVAGTIWWIANR